MVPLQAEQGVRDRGGRHRRRADPKAAREPAAVRFIAFAKGVQHFQGERPVQFLASGGEAKVVVRWCLAHWFVLRLKQVFTKLRFDAVKRHRH